MLKEISFRKAHILRGFIPREGYPTNFSFFLFFSFLPFIFILFLNEFSFLFGDDFLRHNLMTLLIRIMIAVLYECETSTCVTRSLSRGDRVNSDVIPFRDFIVPK